MSMLPACTFAGWSLMPGMGIQEKKRRDQAQMPRVRKTKTASVLANCARIQSRSPLTAGDAMSAALFLTKFLARGRK